MFKVNSCEGIYINSLDVRFTKACDNACSFCIEKNGIDQMSQNVEKMIEGTLKSKKPTILILGGEPFLSPKKLLEYVRGIREHVKEIIITTSLPAIMSLENETALILELIDGLNVSIQHYDWELNNEILQASSKHNRLNQLKEISEVYGKKIRVNLNLVRGVIDTKEKLTTAINLLFSFGIKEVKINELQHDEKHVSYEEIMGKNMLSPYAFGCQTDISKHWGKRVILKRACFYVQGGGNIKASFFDYIKVLLRDFLQKFQKPKNRGYCVLYENGRLSYGWISKENC